jgi:hypothetical protein
MSCSTPKVITFFCLHKILRRRFHVDVLGVKHAEKKSKMVRRRLLISLVIWKTETKIIVFWLTETKIIFKTKTKMALYSNWVTLGLD